jgi:type IV pilus assembly protein PilE
MPYTVLIGKVETMKTEQLTNAKGFTLIEVMVVLVIVAILLALAYPSYVDYVRKSNRGDAQQLLMNWSVNQEIWRANNPQYATTAQLPAPNADNYDLTIGNLSGTTYTLTASAKSGNDQNNDKARDGTSCATLTLNQNGAKTPATCWE